MMKPGQVSATTLRQQRLLDALQGGARTWDELRAVLKINDDNLGFTISELLDLRKIWTAERDGVRIYAIERRTGLVPRFQHPLRRTDDRRG
jgi:hypothetical protein